MTLTKKPRWYQTWILLYCCTVVFYKCAIFYLRDTKLCSFTGLTANYNLDLIESSVLRLTARKKKDRGQVGRNLTNTFIPVKFISDILQLLSVCFPQLFFFCCQIAQPHVLELLLLLFKVSHCIFLFTLCRKGWRHNSADYMITCKSANYSDRAEL